MAQRSLFVAATVAGLFVGSELIAQCPGWTPPTTNGPQRAGRFVADVDPVPENPSFTGKANPNAGTPTGSPSTPGSGAPRPSTPSTGGASGSSSGSAPSTPTTGGSAMEFVRGTTSAARLTVDWQYPVPDDIDAQTMEFDAAIAEICGDDARPLLILRECESCAGTSRALLDSGQNDERTILLTRWFHCVKLPNHVWEPSHPYHAVFQGLGDAHLMIASRDGSTRIPFSGVQPRASMWRSMYKVLRAEYQRDARQAVGGLLELLDVYDRIDDKLAEAQTQLDRALEFHGPDSSRYAKAKQRLERERAELDRALTRETELAELGLKAKTVAAAEAPAEDAR